MDMIQGLFDLAQKLRAPDGTASPETILLINTQSMIGSQLSLIRKLESEAERRIERSTVALERLATAVEQAAQYGWGNVRSEDLGTE